MACFSDLPFELQIEIWTLVLPFRGGVQWVEFEGIPQPSHIISQSLKWNQDLFDGREPNNLENSVMKYENQDYKRYAEGLDRSSLFFKSLYTIIPSFHGNFKRSEDVVSQEVKDEIIATQRCRQLSTYTLVTTLLSTCQTSRLAALNFLNKMIPNAAWPIYRGTGCMHRPRSLNTWKQQYQDDWRNSETVDKLVPTICGALDLVVFRLHTAKGLPKDILNHVYYQMKPWNSDSAIPEFDRIGIEWHTLWATQEGRKYLCEDGIYWTIQLLGNINASAAQLYWLVDGVPRPRWDEYPPAIPAAFSRVIEKRKGQILKYWQADQAWKDQVLKHHNLSQEFEANGRRYYIVFVVADWASESHLETSFRDPAVDWNGPFPGGENIWPESLRPPVRVARELQPNLPTDSYCSYVLSWEPM